MRDMWRGSQKTTSPLIYSDSQDERIPPLAEDFKVETVSFSAFLRCNIWGSVASRWFQER